MNYSYRACGLCKKNILFKTIFHLIRDQVLPKALILFSILQEMFDKNVFHRTSPQINLTNQL